ncbi:MAG: hypothetical protein FJ146_12130 [Deltaproteobacteria bacterium]|nr:hypothetical protein [Deltaproteobacteria bacterium]
MKSLGINLKKLSRQATAAAMMITLAGCGQSIFSGLRKIDPAAEACRELENDDPNAAISILTSALEGSPGNAQYLSILATAYAQRAGVDPLYLALNMGTDSSSSNSSSLALASSGSSSSFTAMFSLLPSPTQTVLDDIDLAVSILTDQIDATSRQPGDLFKGAIFMTASMVLHVKKLDTSGDGTLTASDLASMTEEDALAILGNLSAAITLLGTSGSDDGGGQAAAAAAASQLEAFSSQITSSSGSTDSEKLRTYLSSSS